MAKGDSPQRAKSRYTQVKNFALYTNKLANADDKATQDPWERISSNLDQILFNERINKLEKDVSNIKRGGHLKTINPRVEEIDGKKEDLFEQLNTSVDSLLSNFNNLNSRLSDFIGLKEVLANLNKEARKWNNVYLLRTIVVLYDSIKHALAEELNKQQVELIKQVTTDIESKKMAKDQFRAIYKKLIDVGFQIIPEPSNAKEQ